MKLVIEYQKIADKIKEADAILIGASNGFSISEGLHIFADDGDFSSLFGDFREKYGLRNILQGFFFQWSSDEERWAFLSRLICRYSGSYTGSPLTDAVKKLVSGKPYFIVTSNGENHFELAGFDAEHILEIEGSWKAMRCARGCHDTLYPTWDIVREMASKEKNGLIPSELVPHCPKCGAPMVINMEPAQELLAAYRSFIRRYHARKLLILEFGIGAGNQLIKVPLMKIASQEPDSYYITFNKGEIYIPPQLTGKSTGVDGNLGEILPELAKYFP